jgi:hypothetical protein
VSERIFAFTRTIFGIGILVISFVSQRTFLEARMPRMLRLRDAVLTLIRLILPNTTGALGRCLVPGNTFTTSTTKAKHDYAQPVGRCGWLLVCIEFVLVGNRSAWTP